MSGRAKHQRRRPAVRWRGLKRVVVGRTRMRDSCMSAERVVMTSGPDTPAAVGTGGTMSRGTMVRDQLSRWHTPAQPEASCFDACPVAVLG